MSASLTQKKNERKDKQKLDRMKSILQVALFVVCILVVRK
jgi:hypothetical protein